MTAKVKSDHLRIVLTPALSSYVLPLVFSLIFALLPLMIVWIGAHDPDFVEEMTESGFVALWPGLFLVVFFIMGVVGLHGVIRDMIHPPQILIDKSSDLALIRFIGGTKRYDREVQIKDLEGFEVLDSVGAYNQMKVIVEELISKNKIGGNSIILRMLKFARNQERKLKKREDVKLARQASQGTQIADPATKEEWPKYYLLIKLRHSVNQVVSEIYWDSESKAVAVADQLAIFVRA